MKCNETVLRNLVGPLLWFAFNQTCTATEYISQESPAPESASKLGGAFDHAFRERPLAEKFLMEGLKERLEDEHPFWRDTKLSFDFRTYDFDRRNSSIDTREAWAAGGRLAYQSGWWNNLGISTAYYNSSKVDAPDGSGPTGLLERGQNNISTIGEANLRYRITTTPLEDSEIRLYRQTLNLPYINKDDSRMLPATHEGYTIQRDNSSLDYIVGHLTKFKNKSREEFIHMSEAAGARDLTRALPWPAHEFRSVSSSR
jgi:hypothetical protein